MDINKEIQTQNCILDSIDSHVDLASTRAESGKKKEKKKRKKRKKKEKKKICKRERVRERERGRENSIGYQQRNSNPKLPS